MNATGQRKVLIVDDSADDLLVLGEILRPFYSVRAAADAALALEALRTERKPDCILLDVVMPEEDGLELCRRLRADPATSGIPIIFVTSRASEEDQALGFASGAVDYVVKPVSPYLLLARVDAHVELKVAREGIELQNQVLIENARLRDEVDQISRHDLKNPLMVILNVPDLLLRKPGITDEERRWLRMIQESARRMLEQINLSVDRYKMEKGTYALKPTSVDALGLARRIAAMHAEIGGKEIQFDFLIEGIPPVPGVPFSVAAEEPLLYTMLSNLMKNAVEASARGARVSLRFTAQDRAKIAIHNDRAVPASIRARFFEKFATAGKTGGMGLGTYSARLIARTLGGDIEMETSEESGTTVTVILPPAGT